MVRDRVRGPALSRRETFPAIGYGAVRCVRGIGEGGAGAADKGGSAGRRIDPPWSPRVLMADVFVSYKREDRARVKPIVDALLAEDFSVWWDVGIPGGAAWRQAIHEELLTAKCVIVMWSALSVGPAGEFVQDEASLAKSRGVYLPVALDDVRPPLGFGQSHTLSLSGWNGRRNDPSLVDVFLAVEKMVGAPPSDIAVQSVPVAAPQRGAKPVVAVLAFRCPPGDEAQAFFAEGLAEDVIIGLSRSSMLSVAPAQSSLAFDAQGLTADKIASRLGADYLLQGQIRPMGATVRVAAHLVHGPSEKAVWSGRYDRPAHEISTTLDELVATLVGTVETALLAHEEKAAFARADDDLTGWDLFLRGRSYFWRGRRNDTDVARECLTQALAINPKDGLTLAMLAHCSLHAIWIGAEDDPRGAIREARRLALEAVSLDGSDAFAHHTLGLVLSMMGKLDDAMAEQRRVLDLNPYLASATGEIARLLLFSGDTAEALAGSNAALLTSPNDPHAWLWLRSKALACFVEGRHGEATSHAADACARRPDYYFLHELLAICAAAAGDAARARAAIEEARSLMPHCGDMSPEALRATHPFTNPEHFDRLLAAYQAARSMPETQP